MTHNDVEFNMTASVQSRLAEIHERYKNACARRSAFSAGFVAGREFATECIDSLIEALTGFSDAGEVEPAVSIFTAEMTLEVSMVRDELCGLNDSTKARRQK